MEFFLVHFFVKRFSLIVRIYVQTLCENFPALKSDDIAFAVLRLFYNRIASLDLCHQVNELNSFNLRINFFR
jgi:hypothetical protein